MKGQASVKIVEGKNLITTTEKQMGDDMATLAELEAIHMAIGVLNNDDALDLFKKTDTKAMLVQQKVSLLQKYKASSALVKNPVLLNKVFSNVLSQASES